MYDIQCNDLHELFINFVSLNFMLFLLVLDLS